MWQDVAQASAPFLREQRRAGHFEFFGIDVIADADGECWLIEVNRVPGLESSNNRCKPQEDAMFDEMMLSTLQMVLAPLHERAMGNDDHGGNNDVPLTSGENSSQHEPEERTKEEEQSSCLAKNEEEKIKTTTEKYIKETIFNITDHQSQNGQLPADECPPLGWWRKVCAADPAAHTSSPFVFKNLFNWKAFTSKNKSKLFV
jgi:hypothetical protein